MFKKLSRRQILRGAAQATVLYGLGGAAAPLWAQQKPVAANGQALPQLPAKIARGLKRSAVVSMGRAKKGVYDAYGITVVDWGGGPRQESDKALADFRSQVRLAQAQGIQYNAGIPMLTGFAGMLASCPDYMQAVCRDIAGQPIHVPWLWDQQYKGQRGYNFWFCSNNPLYQKYLRDLTALAMKAEPDGFHIDDYGGTTGSLWHGGCFCPSCMEGFRKHLAAHVAPERLRALGIPTLEGFDYGKFLMPGHVGSAAEFLKKKGSLPLYDEFMVFQIKAAAGVVRGLQEYAEQLRGKPLVRCVNGAPPSAQAFAVAAHVDHYSCEIERGTKEKKLSMAPPFAYKCGDMIGRGIAGTAAGWDWAHVIDTGAIGLVRFWIAEAYACGHSLMTPSERQWAYTEKKGTHWYQARPENFADLYQFVRHNAELFDGYDGAAQVGVVFDHHAWRQYKTAARDAAVCLFAANIPFALVGAGDELLDLRLSEQALTPFERVIVPAQPLADPAQQAVLDKAAAAGKIIPWRDAATLRAALKPWVAVEGADGVWALPRRATDRPEAPLIVHLLNRNYDYATDAVAPQANLTLWLGEPLLRGKRPTRCTAYAAKENPAGLSVAPEAGGIRVNVPELKLWSVLKLE